MESVVWYKHKVLTAVVCLSVFLLGNASWSEVFANELVEHHTSGVEFGGLGQVNLRHLAPSLGVYALLVESNHFEVHASAWANPLSFDGGVGVGTLHSVSDRLWLGWEISAESEHDDLFFGLGPVLELQVVQHRLHTFLKVPLGVEHSTHHDRFGWAAIVGLTVAVWH